MPEELTVAEERVRAGAAWLDERLGSTWIADIRLDDLRLSDSCECILGQLGHKLVDDPEGEFTYAMFNAVVDGDGSSTTLLTVKEASELGFCGGGFSYYQELQLAWEDEILRRFEHG